MNEMNLRAGCRAAWCLALVLLLLLRLGMLPAESAVPLKLLDWGVSKEALAGMVSFCVHSSPCKELESRLMAGGRLALIQMLRPDLPAESAAPLKLLEWGVSKEALAGIVSLWYMV